jgi:uncharacterized protein (DUF1501 family)
MSQHDRPDCGCTEYRQVSRRNFMRVGGSLAIAAAMPGWLPRVAFADSHKAGRDVVVSIFLRGGVDSLSMCVPFNEKAYYDLRPTLAVAPPDASDPNRATALDDDFGFPQDMTALMDAYNDNDLLVVHACGLKNPTRSHFEAMHFMEVGQGDPGALFTGWLGRHLESTAPTLDAAVLRAVGIGYGLPRTLVGGPGALAIADMADFGLDGDSRSEKARMQALEAMYAPYSDPLKTGATNTLQTIDLLETIDFDHYKPKGRANYPDSNFGYALKSTAALIKADIGVEAVAIDLDGWDTHEEQGSIDGYMAGLMRDLSRTLAAFHRDMWASSRNDVAVMCMTEFGRNAFENGSRGTDHGHGSLMLAMGGSVAGGRVMTEWPGLNPSDLYDRQDLDITIDYRDIVTEVLTKRAGNTTPGELFPDKGYTPKDLGVIA